METLILSTGRPAMPWKEFNLHIRMPFFETIRDAILDFVESFVSENRNLFEHWHYMIELDECEKRVKK